MGNTVKLHIFMHSLYHHTGQTTSYTMLTSHHAKLINFFRSSVKIAITETPKDEDPPSQKHMAHNMGKLKNCFHSNAIKWKHIRKQYISMT